MKALLTPFHFSSSQAYIQEWGEGYLRFFRDHGLVLNAYGNPYELNTNYLEAELPLLKFAQSADVQYIVHPDHYPAKLTRYSHTNWTLKDVDFNPPPVYEAGIWPDADLTLGAMTGTNVLFTTSDSVFMQSDVNRAIEYEDGKAIIVEYISATSVRVDIVRDFTTAIISGHHHHHPIASIPAGEWNLTRSPRTVLTLGVHVNVDHKTTLTLSTRGWRDDDVGKYVVVNDGTIEIYKVDSATVAHGRIVSRLTRTDATKYWTLEKTQWNEEDGYPTAVAFYEQRLWFARGVTVWGSVSGDYENFARNATKDDATIQFTLVSGQVDSIRWLLGHDVLIAGTAGGPWKISASSADEAISQTNVSVKRQDITGAKDASPIVTTGGVLWITRDAMDLIQMAYSFEVDKWTSVDMARLSRHIFKGNDESLSGISSISFQKSPIPIAWGIRNDGQLVCMTYETQEQVYAWFRVKLDGIVESLAIITENDKEDEIWISIKRTVNGVEVYYIEYFKPFEFFSEIQDCYFVESGLTYEGASTSTLSGLDHLEGESVVALINGYHTNAMTVASGAVTLPRAGTKIHIGLPMTSIVEPMKLHFQAQTGTTKTKHQKISRVGCIFHETGYGVKVGEDATHMRPVLDLTEGELHSRELDFTFPGNWDLKATMRITQDKPLPMTILGLVPRWNVNED